MHKHIQTVLLPVVLALAVVLAAGQACMPAYAAGDDRIYYFNMSGAADGNFLLVQSDGHWGLIDAGHRYADTIQDSDGTVYSVSQGDGLSSQISCRNGKDAAQFMVNKLGVTHLDFIVGTHAHSDHIGGIPEIAASTFTDISGKKIRLVDGNTTYYYKEYIHINNQEDDLVKASDSSWHNQAFVYQAVNTMKDLGVNVVDVSKSNVIHGDPGNSYGDYITFRMGDMSFRLYNLYAQNSGNENSNSIVTVLKNDKYEVVNLADIDIYNAAIDETSIAIGKDFSNVDVVVAGHHGYSGSNTKTMFDTLKPAFVVVTTGSNASVFSSFDFAAAQPYAASQYGTSFYSTALSQHGIVTDLSGNSVWVYDLQNNGSLKDAFYSSVKSTGKTGWVSWINVGETLWSYLENGVPVHNCWKWIDDRCYYFYDNGIMAANAFVDNYYVDASGAWVSGYTVPDQTGWIEHDGNWAYRFDDGSWASGWLLMDGNWYYFGQDKFMVKGRQYIDGVAYYFDDNGVQALNTWVNGCYLDSNGRPASGWQLIDGNWYYFGDGAVAVTGWQEIDGTLYFFRDDGTQVLGDWLGSAYVDSSGAAVTGWQLIHDNWYYFGRDYAYVTGWQEIDGTLYFFRDDGTQVLGDWLGSAYVDSSGAAVTGWQLIHDNWYYFGQDYAYVTGWQEIDGQLYFFYDNGVQALDAWLGNVYVNSSGMPVTGWQLIHDKWYYFESDYTPVKDGWREIDSTLYFFYDDGSLAVNTWLGGVYVDENGRAVTGWQFIQDNWYYFGSDYSYVTGWQEIDGKTYYFYEDGTQALDTTIDGYYVDSAGVWNP